MWGKLCPSNTWHRLWSSPKSTATFSDYHHVFEETPIYTLLRMIFMRLLGWQCYLLANTSPMYPSGTNVGSINIWTDFQYWPWHSSTSNLPRRFSNLMRERGSSLLTSAWQLCYWFCTSGRSKSDSATSSNSISFRILWVTRFPNLSISDFSHW